MKQKLLSLLAAGLMVFSIVGCKNANSGNNSSSQFVPDEEGEDEVSEELVMPTNVTEWELDDTDYDSLNDAPTNMIRVFYHRNDNNDSYTNYRYWRIWAWDPDGGNGWWYEFTKYNAFGVICEIPVSAVAANGTSLDKLGMVITTCASQTATWSGTYSKDPDSDLIAEINANNPGGIQRLYVKTATPTVYYTQESVFMSTLEYARYTDMKTVRVVFSSSKSDFKLYKPRFTVTKNGETISSFAIEDYKLSKSGGGYQGAANLVFDKEFDYYDQYQLLQNEERVRPHESFIPEGIRCNTTRRNSFEDGFL